MPAKGKHRRPKTPRFSRSIAVAGTGGAALALPFLGATGAHATTAQSAAQSVAEKTVQSVPTVAKKAAKAHAGTRTYTVKSGDCLAKIADEHQVRGGWHRLYRDNHQAVGGNPSLIHPGLKLLLGKKAAAFTQPTRAQAPSYAPAAPSAPAAEPSAASDASGQSAPAAGTSADTAANTVTTVSTGFTLPVQGATIGTSYHVAGSMWSSGYHTGVDFVVPTGTPVKAVGTGTVVSAGWGGAYGNQVVIRLADGYYAQYAHLSQLSVTAGQAVAPGRQVGLSGATGNVTGPHLHFEIRTTPNYGSDVDPVSYLRAHGVAVA